MTPSQAATLKFFKPREWKNLALVDFSFAVFMDDVRRLYGKPLILTDSARLPDDKPSGYSPTSLHYIGRAADLRWTFSAADLFNLVNAAIRVAGARPVEIELVKSRLDQHVHLGLFTNPQRPSVLIVAAD